MNDIGQLAADAYNTPDMCYSAGVSALANQSHRVCICSALLDPIL